MRQVRQLGTGFGAFVDGFFHGLFQKIVECAVVDFGKVGSIVVESGQILVERRNAELRGEVAAGGWSVHD